MRLSTLLISAATSLLSIPSTSARITGFYAPATVVPGETLPILIRAENYVQSVQDVAVAFGITPAEEHYPGTLGTFMGEKSIGPGKWKLTQYSSHVWKQKPKMTNAYMFSSLQQQTPTSSGTSRRISLSLLVGPKAARRSRRRCSRCTARLSAAVWSIFL